MNTEELLTKFPAGIRRRNPQPLPDKPSELLRLALKDMQAVLRSGKVHVKMHIWMESNDNGCSVCLAGAVMLRSGKIPKGFTVVNNGLRQTGNNREINKLDALDWFRRGYIYSGLKQLKIKKPAALPVYFPVSGFYENDPYYRQCFYQDINKMIRMFKTHGL